MLDTTHASLIADRFGLGDHARLDGPMAIGRLGEICRLTSDRGRFAVKHARFAVVAEDAELDAAYQDLVRLAGVPMPAVVRAVVGTVLADIPAGRVRVYEWVDVLPACRRLDPGEVRGLVAAIHAVDVPTDKPVDGWYVDPVGADAWPELLTVQSRRERPHRDRHERARRGGHHAAE